MDHNPYTPPAAPVADALEALPAERPRNVTTAVALLWITAALNFAFTTATKYYPLHQAVGNTLWLFVPLAIGLAVGFGFCWWIYGAVGNGRNWARIVVAVLTVLGGCGDLWLAA